MFSQSRHRCSNQFLPRRLGPSPVTTVFLIVGSIALAHPTPPWQPFIHQCTSSETCAGWHQWTTLSVGSRKWCASSLLCHLFRTPCGGHALQHDMSLLLAIVTLRISEAAVLGSMVTSVVQNTWWSVLHIQLLDHALLLLQTIRCGWPLPSLGLDPLLSLAWGRILPAGASGCFRFVVCTLVNREVLDPNGYWTHSVSIAVLIANVLCNSFTCDLVPAVEMKAFSEWFSLIMLLEGFH